MSADTKTGVDIHSMLIRPGYMVIIQHGCLNVNILYNGSME